MKNDSIFHIATEGAGASQTVEAMLDLVRANVKENVKTIEDADALELKLSEEAVSFNDCLSTMKDAIIKYESGDIDKDQLTEICKPCITTLKEKCTAIHLGKIDGIGEDDISEEEIAVLSEYIVGCKDIVAARKTELQETPETAATEGIIAGVTKEAPAMEGANWQAVKGILGEKSRDARKAVRAGKTAMKNGDTDKAIEYFETAKKCFADQKVELQKLPKDMWDTISSWVNVGLLPLIYSFIGDGGYKDSPNKNVNVAAVMNYLNRAMKKCDDLIAAAKSGKTEATEATEATCDELCSVAVAVESFYDDADIVAQPATESVSVGAQIRKSPEAKTANQLYKQAKKLHSLGSKDKAVETMNKAMGLYEKCIERLKKEGRFYKSKRKTSTTLVSVGAGVSVSDRYDTSVTDNYSDGMAMAYFKDRVDSCKATIMIWENKAGKKDLKTLKAELKAERKEVKAAKKAAKTAATESVGENATPATEGATWQAIKGLLGEKSREARKALRAGKTAMKNGDTDKAVEYFETAKKNLAEQKEELQKLPKDMWDTCSSWVMGVNYIIPIIYSFIGDGGYKDSPNKNVNVAAVINYLNRAMKKCDDLIAAAKSGKTEATEAADAICDELHSVAIAVESFYDDAEYDDDEDLDEDFDEDLDEDELEEMATEATIAVMLAEDGIED